MDINSIPDIFQSKLRIAIVSCLMTGEKTFSEIKEVTGATDGNLSTHLAKLVEAGCTTVTKDFFNNKPRTRYVLTTNGREDFVGYVNLLESIVKQHRTAKGS